MSVIKNIKYIILSLFIVLIFTQVKAEVKIAFVEIETILNKSLAGKSMLQQLNKLDSANKKTFLDKRKKLLSAREKITSQQNILSKEEFEKKITNFNSEFKTFQTDSNKKIDALKDKRDNAMRKIMNELKILLSEYSQKNELSFIIDQKNIVIGKSDLNITNEIIKLLDQKIKKIKLD
tara:strand:- start:257 stop:790 length:534 start_codon:yes stop_codon:yes gene_type:complete